MKPLKLILNVDGFWRESNKICIPPISGVYIVYENKYNKSDDTIELKRILYIGESDNMNESVIHHKNYAIWKNNLNSNCELSFAVVPVVSFHRSLVKSAYIYQHRPILNDCTQFTFNFERTILISVGKIGLIEPNIDLEKENNTFSNNTNRLQTN